MLTLGGCAADNDLSLSPDEPVMLLLMNMPAKDHRQVHRFRRFCDGFLPLKRKTGRSIRRLWREMNSPYHGLSVLLRLPCNAAQLLESSFMNPTIAHPFDRV